MSDSRTDKEPKPKLMFSFNPDSSFYGNRWLEKRLKLDGDYPDPEFARLGTVAWMRALALLVEGEFEDSSLRQIYSQKIQRRSPVDSKADTAVFVNTMMALQNLSSIRAISKSPSIAPIIRPAIVCWYYGVYFAASAMVAAKQGVVPETHAGTSKAWDACIAQRDLAHGPFAYRLSSLVKKDGEAQVLDLRKGSTFSLPATPRDKVEALGAHLSYLGGTRKNAAEMIQSQLLRKEIKSLGKDNFRTKAAQEIRDARLSKGFVGFLDQAFRYRGKAHYRDPIYLGYADTDSTTSNQLLNDLDATLTAFVKMTAHFCSRCVERGTWDALIADLENNRATSDAVEAVRLGS